MRSEFGSRIRISNILTGSCEESIFKIALHVHLPLSLLLQTAVRGLVDLALMMQSEDNNSSSSRSRKDSYRNSSHHMRSPVGISTLQIAQFMQEVIVILK